MESKRQYNILVTGGNGFIGWNFLQYLINEKPIPYGKIVNVDAEEYASINHIPHSTPNYVYHHGRMKNSHFLIEQYDIDLIFNFAAHTHVDNSIKGVTDFVQSNVLDMSVLAEAARLYWEKRKEQGLFIQISTDEVFGSVENQDGVAFNEFSTYCPNNPYAATKAAAELMLFSFGQTYNFPYIITNCSNNYGGGQHKEKLIPKIINNCLEGKDIPIYGDGKQQRDWIYVKDHCKGIVAAANKGNIGESYLFGTNKTIENITLVKLITKIIEQETGKQDLDELITHVDDRLGHDVLYKTDYTKSYTDLGWYPETPLLRGLIDTVRFYI